MQDGKTCKKIVLLKVDRYQLKILLEKIRDKKIDISSALNKLKQLPYKNLKFSKIDTHRSLRKGFPEVVFCPGKTIKQIKEIINQMIKNENNILLTRSNEDIFKVIKKKYPKAKYNQLGKTIVIQKKKIEKNKGLILIITAGTSDIPVAEEAYVTAEVMGNKVEKLYDVGVAGIHRLLSHHEKINKANVIIVVAGMDGALASVVGGLVDKPIITVPTSIGYGASFHGLAALLTMLNNCASGIAVVNIDNGFGAAHIASLINNINKGE